MTTIYLESPKSKVQQDVTCHLVPSNINFDSSCEVSKYFTPYIKEKEHYLTCSLRGRPLQGHKINVPENYTGVILEENKKLSTTEDQRDLKLVANFKEFTAWNWDHIPSSNDKVARSMDWIKLASIIHKPVSDYENVEIESSSLPTKRKLSESD